MAPRRGSSSDVHDDHEGWPCPGEGRPGAAGEPGAVMRIAQVAPLYEAVPPGAYGGTERIIASLCDGLVAQGHEVTLFAPDTSETAAKLAGYGDPMRTRFSADELVDLAPHLHLQMLAELYERDEEFDVVHSHLDIWTYPFTRLSDVPTVLTMHGR